MYADISQQSRDDACWRIRAVDPRDRYPEQSPYVSVSIDGIYLGMSADEARRLAAEITAAAGEVDALA